MRFLLHRAGAWTLVAGCLAASEARIAHAQPVPQVEYDVISAAIRVIVEREPWARTPASEAEAEPIRQLIILGAPDPEGPATLRAVEPDSGPAMDGTALSDFAAKAGRGSFEMRFSGIGVYHLFPLAELRAFRERGGWPGFYERYPGAAGLFAFSRVGVSEDGSEAIVHVLHIRGSDWGHSDAMLFRRDGSTWRLAGEERLTDI